MVRVIDIIACVKIKYGYNLIVADIEELCDPESVPIVLVDFGYGQVYTDGNAVYDVERKRDPGQTDYREVLMPLGYKLIQVIERSEIDQIIEAIAKYVSEN